MFSWYTAQSNSVLQGIEYALESILQLSHLEAKYQNQTTFLPLRAHPGMIHTSGMQQAWWRMAAETLQFEILLSQKSSQI